jgi:hypothetical protein
VIAVLIAVIAAAAAAVIVLTAGLYGTGGREFPAFADEIDPTMPTADLGPPIKPGRTIGPTSDTPAVRTLPLAMTTTSHRRRAEDLL